jgi:predicted AlkP superfamily phosphohydrolase/phosphomutase
VTRTARRLGLPLVAAVGALLLTPGPAAAYIGPGAGFAVLGSFLALLLGLILSALSLLAWPVRQLVRARRRRRALGRARVKRAVIVGFDGMDAGLTEHYLREGKLPNLARLAAAGTFQPLATTTPPISPVAWSSFLTGVNPGKHNIYDFLARDPASYRPYLSSARVHPVKRRLTLGRLAIPLERPRVELFRKAKPFWHYLGDAGVPCAILRVPITFPPERFHGVLLSGMCVPDLKGSQGTFSFFTAAPDGVTRSDAATVVPLEPDARGWRAWVGGPADPLRVDGGRELRVPFTVQADPTGEQLDIALPDRRLRLRAGEYSEWVELTFRAGWGIRVHGMCRFYVNAIQPRPELYATPVNIHPARPALPISHPSTYAVYLAKLLGPYATLGLAEDTWALNDGVLTDEAFLAQCALIHAERERMFFDALEKTPRGLCVCVFDITDRVQHMFWRAPERDPETGRTRPTAAGGERIEAVYRQMDELVGRIRQRLDDETALFVISDHGFTSFQRGVNVNTWLEQQGYLARQAGSHEVDWSRTRAYALGLNGLYLNLQGRERQGVVRPGPEAQALKRELIRQLTGLVDPETGQVAIRQVVDCEAALTGPYRENAPDLILGYDHGYRAGWDAVLGRVTPAVFEDNGKAWSGDHCVDPRLVPGVLFCNRPVTGDQPAIVDMAATVLSLFGLEVPPHLDGKAWSLGSAPSPSTEGRGSR